MSCHLLLNLLHELANMILCEALKNVFIGRHKLQRKLYAYNWLNHLTWVGKHDITPGSAEHNIIFSNECNKFSNKWQRIWDFIYYITVKTIGI